MKSRDEFLAREIMQWHWEVHEAVKDWCGHWEGWVASDGKWKVSKWEPGKSWSQTGMILKEMEQDFFITVRQWNDQVNKGYDVAFNEWESDNCGNAIREDFREAIATAAARVKGWE